MNRKKAVVYTRVSTDKDEQEMSLKIQQEYYEKYCNTKNYDLAYPVETYAETGTGTNVRRRPLFIRMMYYAGLDYEENNEGTDIFRSSKRQAEFDIILVKNAPRFSRNSEIGIATVKLLRKQGVEVVFENAGVSSFDENADLMLGLLFTMAESESQGLSRNITFSKRHVAEQGIYRPARLAYGYARDENQKIVIVKDQAKIIQFIHDSYPEQGSLVLSRILNEKGIFTQTGKMWSPDKIARIIINRIYTGTAVVHRTKKANVTDTERMDAPEKDWIEIPNAVPVIITVEQYEYNNEVRKSRTNKAAKRGRRPSINNIYEDKLFCDHCGSRFVRHIGFKGKITYMCQNRRKAQGCKVRGIAINNVNRALDAAGTTIPSDIMKNHAYYESLMDAINAEEESLQMRIDEYTAQIEPLEEENEIVSRGIVEQLGNGSQVVIDNLSKIIDKNAAEIGRLEEERSLINIEAIITMRKKVTDKLNPLNEFESKKMTTTADLILLLKSIHISDYDCVIEFHMPSFEKEIYEFNEVFRRAVIDDKLHFSPFIKTIRRDYEAARIYWRDIDEQARQLEAQKESPH